MPVAPATGGEEEQEWARHESVPGAQRRYSQPMTISGCVHTYRQPR